MLLLSSLGMTTTTSRASSRYFEAAVHRTGLHAGQQHNTRSRTL